MSLDNVQVNMSRLALARAIKTPDGDDTDADPWNKSVIFNQSHIPQAIEQHRRQERNRGSAVPRQARNRRSQQEKISPPTSLHQPRTPTPQPVNDRKAGLRKTYIPSDDEDDDEEEEDEDEEDESSDSEDEELNSRTKQSAPVSKPLSIEEPAKTSNTKQTRKQPLPSDDEDSNGSENEDDDDDDTSVYATGIQRNSTPVRLQNEGTYSSGGSSNSGRLAAHQRSRSLGDIIDARTRSPIPQVQNDHTPPQQWRKSADYMGRSGDMRDGQLSTNAFRHGKSQSSDKLDKMPLAKPATPIPGRPFRRSTIVDYEGTHQQQKLTYHAAPQLGQFQQYPPNMNRKNQSNRISMSGMDMLLQLENEKQQATKGKPKKLDSTHAPIEGLLAKLPESGTYNVNFQQLQGHQMHGSRAHRFEAGSRDSFKPIKTRPNSAMGYFDARPHVSPSPSPDHHRRSRLSPRMEAPYPTSSISTPASHLQRQYQQQLLMMDQQQQMMQNQYLVSGGQMLQVPMNYGLMMPSFSPDAAMRQSLNRPSSSVAKRSSSAWGGN